MTVDEIRLEKAIKQHEQKYHTPKQITVEGWMDEDGSIVFDHAVRDKVWKTFNGVEGQRVTVIIAKEDV